MCVFEGGREGGRGELLPAGPELCDLRVPPVVVIVTLC